MGLIAVPLSQDWGGWAGDEMSSHLRRHLAVRETGRIGVQTTAHTSYLLLCAGQGPEYTDALTHGIPQHPATSPVLSAPWKSLPRCAWGQIGRSVREGQRRTPTAQSTSTGGRGDTGREAQCIWPLKGELRKRCVDAAPGGRLGAATGLTVKARVGQMNRNLEPAGYLWSVYHHI